MSRSSEQKKVVDALSGYPLMTPKQVAAFLNCDAEKVRGMDLLYVDTGLGRKVIRRYDPVDVAVFVLAGKEGLTPDEYWEKHGPEGTPELVRRFVVQIRKVAA